VRTVPTGQPVTVGKWMSVSVTIDAKKLMALPGAIAKAREQALEDTAGKIDRDAKRSAPVDTGRLRSSLHVERPGETSYAYSWNGGSDEGKIEVTVGVGERAVGSNVEYAAAQEFGTMRNRARPYLIPAYHKNRHLLKERMIKRTNDAIRKATK